MKIVVTGALGHIGSRLIRSLPDSFPDAEIVMLDDLSTQRYCSLYNLPSHGSYRFIEADVMSADLDAIFSGASVVVHLAAITNAEGSLQIAEQVESVNFKGTERVARACINIGCSLVFLSTTSVYGTQADTVDEDCSPDELKPQSPYAASKLHAEQLLQTMGANEGLRFITCRFGTIFGTSIGMRFHTAVNKFVWQACMGKPLSVWSSALDQNRPYLDLGDAISALSFIISKDLFDCKTYNILTLNASVKQIVEEITSFIPDVTVQYVDSKIMNQLSYTVLNHKFRDLGFRFKGELHQSIYETVAMLRGVRKW